MRLYMIDENKWQIHSKYKGAFEGSLKQVITYCVLELGISFEDLDIAVDEMLKHDHNGAEFGIERHFLFTFAKQRMN